MPPGQDSSVIGVRSDVMYRTMEKYVQNNVPGRLNATGSTLSHQTAERGRPGVVPLAGFHTEICNSSQLVLLYLFSKQN